MGSEDADIILIFVSSAAIIVILAVLVALFVVIYQKRIVAQEMRLQQLEADAQQELLRATIEGQERERKRLAKDLHDGIGSLLWGLKLSLRQLPRQQDEKGLASEALHLLDESITEVRRVSHNLLPVTLENFGLIQALSEWIESIQAEAFRVDFQTRGTPIRPGTEIEMGLFRVVQELIQNTLKHAKASEARLCLTFASEAIELNYHDNGIGLQPSQQPTGIGTKNMQSRIQALDGSISFPATNTPGFQANITVPIN